MTNSCFFLAADAKYFPYACLAARRILDVSRKTTPGFIMHLGANEDDVGIAYRLLKDRVRIVDVTNFMADSGYRFRPGSVATFIRLFADRFSEFAIYDRIAHIDCDVLFNRDIADLVDQPIHAHLLAAHDDYMYFRPGYRDEMSMQPGAPYFNAGIIVFNMRPVREEDLLKQARKLAVDGQMNDQNALNVAFEGKWQTMHPNWNLMSNGARDYRFSQAYARHFAGGKPWGSQIGVELEALKIWRDLAEDTPWNKPFRQRLPFERGITKRFLRRFDAVGGLFGNDVHRRRARYDAAKMHRIYARQAEEGAMAVQFPEVLGGFG
ncbi:glycosyltransferase [Mesorhizobium sp. WSM3868]|uniref:glycosyltransferase family 8 protein n=1 Tax=Mesorhizobium sp. WSM3868 TaxID=2029405 RepID=UPI000BAF0A16|nr:glycosyltransferase [Mesorhizobium sp. WSM3868]PBB34472.1 hypothetical protein CK221_20915 [Mesorhizobium sp. WSM3868]